MICPQRPRPDDFRQNAAKMNQRQLIAHYASSPYTVRRWLNEVGAPSRTNGRRRPAPEDFAARAAEMGAEALCDHYRAGPTTVNRWKDELGIVGGPAPRKRQKMKAPADFAPVVVTLELVAALAHFGVSRETFYRWEAETGAKAIRRPREVRRREAPADFAAVYPTLSIKALVTRYATSTEVVTRWAREAGLARRPSGRRLRSLPFKRVAASKPVAQTRSTTFSPTNRVLRDMTAAGQAADFLRRFGPVARCDAAGRYKSDGDYWRRGSTVVSAAEIVERAERLGFDPGAWARLAA